LENKKLKGTVLNSQIGSPFFLLGTSALNKKPPKSSVAKSGAFNQFFLSFGRAMPLSSLSLTGEWVELSFGATNISCITAPKNTISTKYGIGILSFLKKLYINYKKYQ
jgi:hypothetical protein